MKVNLPAEIIEIIKKNHSSFFKIEAIIVLVFGLLSSTACLDIFLLRCLL